MKFKTSFWILHDNVCNLPPGTDGIGGGGGGGGGTAPLVGSILIKT